MIDQCHAPANMSHVADRAYYLDALRGLAALTVAVHHYFAAFYPYTIFGASGGVRQHSEWEFLAFYPPLGMFLAGHTAVCLFFILSGYVLSFPYLGQSDRFKLLAAMIKRPIRLAGVVVFTIAMAYLIWINGGFFNRLAAQISTSELWLGSYWGEPVDLARFFKDILLSPFSQGMTYNPPLWTIGIELYGSMLVYLFLLLFGAANHRLLLMIGLIFLLRNSLYQGFILGMMLAEIVKFARLPKWFTKVSWWPWGCLGVFVLLSAYPNHIEHQFLLTTPYAFLPPMAGVISWSMLEAVMIFIFVVAQVGVQKHLMSFPLQQLGRISYAFYATHFLLIGSLGAWLFLDLEPTIGYHGAFLTTFSLGLVLTYLISEVITNYIDAPSIALASRIGQSVVRCIEHFVTQLKN